MPGMSPPERYHLVAPLPPLGGWRRMLALDRRATAAGPVVLSYAPPEVLEDHARLTALSRDAEAGARVHHANVLPVLGLETVDDQLVLVEPYRAGTTVRALLEASGRMPAELAVRVARDAAAGLAALHALDAGDGQPFAHGAVSAERILVAEDGTALVTGVGTGRGRSAAEDVRALAEVVAEMVTGERPRPSLPLEATGVPAALAAAIDRARGVGGEAQPRSAAALGDVLGDAYAPAEAAAVAVYVETSAPPPPAAVPPPVPAAPPQAAGPAPIPEVSAELIVPALRPQPEAPEVSAELIAPSARGPADAPEVSAELVPPPDAARTFPAPHPARPVRRVHPVPVFLLLVVLGFVLGFLGVRQVLARGRLPAQQGAAAERAQPAKPEALAAAGAAPSAAPFDEVIALPPPVKHPVDPAPPAAPAPAPARAPATARAPADPRARGAAAPRKPVSISVSAVPAGEVLVDGKVVGRSPIVVEVSAGEHEVRLRDRAEGLDVRRKVKVVAPATPVHFKVIRGTLEVTAPSDTEIYVDGQPVGLGDQRVELWEGWHEVEARRGAARVSQRFQLSSTVTSWTYKVSPTP